MATEEDAMNGTTGRRGFLRTVALAGAAGGTGFASVPGSGAAVGPSKGLDYIDMIERMTRDLMRESGSDIERAADICAEAVASGKKVWYSVRGHNEPICIFENRPGKPSFLSATEKTVNVAAFGSGDALITERTEWCMPAKERGVRLIGILMPFQPQKTRGQGIVHIDYAGPWMEEVCDVCIWDRVPYTVGTMSFDYLPFHAVPAHGAMDGIAMGLVLAATADRLVARGIAVRETPYP